MCVQSCSVQIVQVFAGGTEHFLFSIYRKYANEDSPSQMKESGGRQCADCACCF